MTQPKRGNAFALFALVAAALSVLVISVGPVIYNSVSPPPPPKPALGQIIEGVRDAVSGNATPSTAFSPGLQYVRGSALTLAILAIVLCGVASLRDEHRRITQVAFGLAAITLVWYHFLLVVVVLVVLLLLTFMLGAAV